MEHITANSFLAADLTTGSLSRIVISRQPSLAFRAELLTGSWNALMEALCKIPQEWLAAEIHHKSC